MPGLICCVLLFKFTLRGKREEDNDKSNEISDHRDVTPSATSEETRPTHKAYKSPFLQQSEFVEAALAGFAYPSFAYPLQYCHSSYPYGCPYSY
jgi:hypothetical protein